MQSSFTFTLQTVFYSFQTNSRKTCIVSWIWYTFLSFLHRIFSELLPVFLRTGTMNKLRPSLLNNWAFKLQQTGLACMGDCKTLSTSSKKTNNTGRGSTLLSFMLCPFSESGLNQCQCLSVKLIQYDFVVLNNLCYLFVFFSNKKRIMKPNGNVITRDLIRFEYWQTSPLFLSFPSCWLLLMLSTFIVSWLLCAGRRLCCLIENVLSCNSRLRGCFHCYRFLLCWKYWIGLVMLWLPAG